MKAKIYLRVAKNPSGRTPLRVDASAKPTYRPLTTSIGDPLPTLSFAVMLNIPDEAFRRAEQVIAEIDVPEDLVAIAAEVTP